jgi:hypothetical protein
MVCIQTALHAMIRVEFAAVLTERQDVLNPTLR